MKKPVIVCVDDEKFVLDGLRIVLTQAFGDHVAVEIAEDGQEALELVRDLMAERREVLVVISDYIMPNMKGDELLKHLQRISPNTLKVMLTGRANLEGVTNAVNDADLYHYIAKPWNNQALVEVVRQAMAVYYRERQKEDRIRALLDAVPDLVLLIGPDGVILDCGGQAAGLAVPCEQALGKRIHQILPESVAELMSAKMQESLATGGVVVYEYSLPMDGAPRYYKARLTTCGSDAFVAVVRDISHQKQAEDALARAQEAADAANQARSQFLATLSHEIRGPMTAILGFSELLDAPNLAAHEMHQFLGLIRSNGEALLTLIDDILDLSRIESDRLDLVKTTCSLTQLTKDVLAVVEVRAAEKGLHLENISQHPLPEQLQTDPARLRQILVSLLVNAVKFTERGKVCLTCRCLQGTNQRPQLQFVVTDTGIGISPERINDLFQPFVQVDSSASRPCGGTGLGLAISRRLARSLGGDLQVTSELGRGSTFTLTIDPGPLPDPGIPPAPRTNPTAGERTVSVAAVTAAVTAMPGRVLFVEDNPSIQLVVRFLLQKSKLEVEIAPDGRQACEMVEQSRAEGRPYELILMDIQLPQMDGYEVTHWLRDRGWRGPIIALTANVMSGAREKCLAAGCDDYLAKPVSAAALRATLARYLL